MATEPLKKYDPNVAAPADAGIYGLPFTYDESAVIYIPVPWAATTSYGKGTEFGPEAIFDASFQMDLFDRDVERPDLAGLYFLTPDPKISELHDQAKAWAQPIKDAGSGETDDLRPLLESVNQASHQINTWVENQTRRVLNDQKIPFLIGGDHSCPFGAFVAATQTQGNFGILHFDAHSDTRKSYMGFQHSHASIMNNAAQLPQVTHITQVGIRDYCQEEFDEITRKNGKFSVFFDADLQERKAVGHPFLQTAKEIVATLPQTVWISFDIDGLDPRFCPHTGTPVPGGLDFFEALTVIKVLAQSGRRIIGADVVEVAPRLDTNERPAPILQAADEWDANVGMRLIYKMSALILANRGLRPWKKPIN